MGESERSRATEELANHATGNSRADIAAALDAEALAQHTADQHVLQSLLAKCDSLQRLSSGQPGWGAVQRRLRALAPEIARLQAVCATQNMGINGYETETFSRETTIPDESSSTEEEQSTLLRGGPSAPASEEADDLAARRLRLLALQQELAHPKRTPSMRLLARQRIPRLEEAIKHLIASLAESA